MAHLAIHDALNSIDRRYQTYALNIDEEPDASPSAAVAAAAYGVLINELPTQRMSIDAAYENALAAIADGPAKTGGIAIGQAAAAMIITLRSTDGSSTAQFAFAPGTGPGIWQPTPPPFVPAVLPGWGSVTPFALTNSGQFRPDRPPLFDLTGRKYERDYTEVKGIGAIDSSVRTPEQGEIARFWYEDSPPAWNRIAKAISMSRGLDSWANARLLALVNLAMADGFIAGFDTKYSYSFWRPVTAIRAGDIDDNPDTLVDPGWSSFLVTPPSPDYPSTHSVLGAAAAEAMRLFFGGDEISFSATSGPPFPGITRSFISFSQAAHENANSRVYAGIHFRSACRDGLKMGRKVGKFAFRRSLRPTR
jgi:hypothetical protein